MRTVIRREWQWYLCGSLVAFFAASLLMSGWAGMIPDLDTPYAYAGDALSHSWAMQRVIEGWLFENPRSGYPFGSAFYDYPSSDSGNLFVIKLMSLFTSEFPAVFNIFFLLSFPAVFVSSYLVLRFFGLNRWYALAGGLIYSFLPFHFARIGHSFYLWYFTVPIFFYIAALLFRRPPAVPSSAPERNQLIVKSLLLALLLVVCSNFGVYNALFGLIAIGTSGLAASIRDGNFRGIRLAIMAAAVVTLTVGANVAPSLIYSQLHGKNLHAINRSPVEAEIYGLKLTQLLLPSAGHRSQALAAVTKRYEQNRPLTNENRSATLGFIGAIGFLLLGAAVVAGLGGRLMDERLTLLALIVFMTFLFGTIGGAGALFSELISPLIRGWNRISVFIGFGTIAAFFIVLQKWTDQRISAGSGRIALPLIAASLALFGIWDQNPPCGVCGVRKENFKLDQDFVRRIEQALPTDSAVYQLPYMQFPEVGPQHNLFTYDLVAGFLHSKTLKWSYAGMKGRDGDLFFRALAKEPVEKQLDVIGRLGFAGIYVDRRGYPDEANALIATLTKLLGAGPLFSRADGRVAFFRLERPAQHIPDGLKPAEIMQRAGYMTDQLGSRSTVSLATGIDFAQPELPTFVKSITGLSGHESWGRWSDANLAACMTVEFISPLPRQFTLALTARSFGPNDKGIAIKLGAAEWRADLPAAPEVLRLPVDLGDKQASSIAFCPPAPVSPSQLGMSRDSRRLAIGFISLKIE